jgi:hypothetical protein
VPRAVIAGVDFAPAAAAAGAAGDAALNLDVLHLWRGQSQAVLSTPEARRLHFLHSTRKQATVVAWSRCMATKDWLLVGGGAAGLARLLCVTEGKLDSGAGGGAAQKKLAPKKESAKESSEMNNHTTLQHYSSSISIV